MRIIILILFSFLLYECGGGSGTACLDTDIDGICNTTDTDDDGDGVSDTEDVAPLNSALSAYMDWTTTGTNANKWGAACNGVACKGLSTLLSYTASTGVANGDSGFIDSATANNSRGGMNFTVDVTDDSFQLRSSTKGTGLDSRTPVLVNDAGDGNKTITTSMQTAGPTAVSSSYTMGGNSYTYQYTQSGETVIVEIITPTTHTDQLWVKWNNASFTSPSTIHYNYGVVGRDVAFSALPSSGTASYTGGLDGGFKYDNNATIGILEGNSSFSANWATSRISGTFSNITMSLGGETSTWENMSFTNATIDNSCALTACFNSSGVTSGSDADTSGHWLYGTFFDGSHTSGTAPNSVAGNFRFEDAANTGYGALFFAATKD